jgi:hypothetical protein
MVGQRGVELGLVERLAGDPGDQPGGQGRGQAEDELVVLQNEIHLTSYVVSLKTLTKPLT